ncbi:hypothetical protein G4B88_005848 [Cannabis sativa]|nr:hypothetical protein G4B88_005848 [Cannabis sativa]
MDRDWMSANRLTVKYREGVDFFLEFSAKNADNPDLVHCPCLKCGNMERIKIDQIREHLFKNGIDRSYKVVPFSYLFNYTKLLVDKSYTSSSGPSFWRGQ